MLLSKRAMVIGLTLALILVFVLHIGVAKNALNIQQQGLISFLVALLIESTLILLIITLVRVMDLKEPDFLPYVVLVHLRDSGPVTAKEIKEGIEQKYNVRLAHGAFTLDLYRTMQRGLVVATWSWRQSTSEHRRVKLISLTATGQSFLEELDPVFSRLNLITEKLIWP